MRIARYRAASGVVTPPSLETRIGDRGATAARHMREQPGDALPAALPRQWRSTSNRCDGADGDGAKRTAAPTSPNARARVGVDHANVGIRGSRSFPAFQLPRGEPIGRAAPGTPAYCAPITEVRPLLRVALGRVPAEHEIVARTLAPPRAGGGRQPR